MPRAGGDGARRAFCVDWEGSDGSTAQTLQGVMAETEQAIYAAAGEPFNINSPKQLGRDPV